jgi:hypothetical protein
MTVHCYVPLVCYDGLALLVDRVRAALSGMEPDLRPTGRLGVHTINDQFRAHETFVEYLVQKRL